MNVDTLDELKAAFDRWRTKKRYARERVPDELWERALRAADVHGTRAVARATKFERARFEERGERSKESCARVPTFSRVEISSPAATSYPIAEVETATGLKLRIFAQTPETLSLLSSLCGVGSAS